MRPIKGNDSVSIPLTLDLRNKQRITTEGKRIWLVVISIFWLVSSIIALIGGNILTKVFYPILCFILLLYLYRFVIMKERYFKKKLEELVENDYMFSNSTYWNIYTINDVYPHVVQFTNGTKALFVAMQKGVIIGKKANADYDHYEGIGDAIQQTVKRGIKITHIDYMDIVGKDERLPQLFEVADNVDNRDLKKLLTRMYDHIEYTMDNSYASYDVYCFYYDGRDELFQEELEVCLDYFLEANYIGYKYLDKESIGDLVKVVMNIDEFSVSNACEGLFKEMNDIEYLKVIWTEKDGEKTIVNKTHKELKEIRRIQNTENRTKKLNKKNKKLFKKKKKIIQGEDVEL